MEGRYDDTQMYATASATLGGPSQAAVWHERAKGRHDRLLGALAYDLERAVGGRSPRRSPSASDIRSLASRIAT
jgi:hypothetical protein